MTTHKEALKLALEAFETLTQYNIVRANIFRRFEPTCTGDYVDLREFREKAKPAITAIKEALNFPNGEAQPEQKPVASGVIRTLVSIDKNGVETWKEEPFYTIPPQRTAAKGEDTHRAWVGLTDEEVKKLRYQAIEEDSGYTPLIKATEAKLKEKNTSQDGDCKHCVNGCSACDARRQPNVLP